MLDIVILAAGRGTRMHASLPKVLHTVGGVPLLSHVAMTAKALNPTSVSVIVGYEAASLEALCSALSVHCINKVAPKGTGYAVNAYYTQFKPEHRVLVLYGDVPLVTLETLRAFIEATPSHALGLLTTVLDNPTGFGRIIRHGQAVQRIVEEKDATTQEKTIREVNTGILLLPHGPSAAWLAALSPANAQGEYYLTDVVAMARQAGVALHTHSVAPEECLGVNDKAQLAQVERIYQRRRADVLLKQGVTLADPARFDVRGQLECEEGVFIDVNVVIEGKVYIGRDSVIEPFCILRDCRLGPNTHIKSHSIVEGSEVEAQVSVGPFARIRPQTILKAGSRIGNFVEVKKSIIGSYSKVNHLSYVGDATVGCDVNVGAGTVTCNFDGKNKHSTIIHDGASIGSGTMLVAPIEIGKNATVGAGSTLTKDAPSDCLTLSRAKQTTIESWVSPKLRDTVKDEGV